MGAGIKWLIRVLLFLFYAVAVYLHMNDQPMLSWLAGEHPNVTTFLIFLTCFAYLPMFISVKKQTVGGEETMRKTTLALILALAVAVTCGIYGAYKPFRDGVNNSILGPASVGLANSLTGLYASSFWKTYIVPTRNAFAIGMASMLVVVFVLWRFKASVTQRVKVPKRIYQHAPVASAPPQVIPQTTVAAAPATTQVTAPNPTSTVTVEEEEEEK